MRITGMELQIKRHASMPIGWPMDGTVTLTVDLRALPEELAALEEQAKHAGVAALPSVMASVLEALIEQKEH